MKRILVCEDEDTIRDFVVINLKRSGYVVTDVSNGEDAIRVFEEQGENFDIALLDITMEGIDGFAVCKELRQRSGNLGIIMLTAMTQEMDKVRGLMLGADDYILKPFSTAELIARVDAIYRRVSMTKTQETDTNTIIQSGCFELNLKSRTITKNGALLDLTHVEYQILEYFINNKDTALERNKILDKIWGESYAGDIKIVDVNIRRLRMKIEDEPSKPQFIQTVWGFGYKWSV